MMMTSVMSVFAGRNSYYEEQVAKYEAMKNRTIHYRYTNCGIYTVKTAKFYVREVVGVAEDGSFILAPWRLVSEEEGPALVEFERPGTCVMFAFGFDIMWGTDWPYSGVFWSDVNTPVNNICISSSGMCRTASLKIEVNGRTVFDDWNLSSHDEWKP